MDFLPKKFRKKIGVLGHSLARPFVDFGAKGITCYTFCKKDSTRGLEYAHNKVQNDGHGANLRSC